MSGKIVIICGGAASGKSYLAREMAAMIPGAVLIDIDDFQSAESALNTFLGLEASDRDSGLHQEDVSPILRSCILNVAVRNVKNGRTVFCVMPHLGMLTPDQWGEAMLKEIGARASVSLVWIHADEETIHKRMEKRMAAHKGDTASPDTWKLAHWDCYLRHKPSPFLLPVSEKVRVLDNSEKNQKGVSMSALILANQLRFQN